MIIRRVALALTVGLTAVLAACGTAPHAPTPADLSVEQLAVTPAKVAAGAEVAVAFAVVNAGETAAAASTAQVLLGTDPTAPSASDRLLAEVPTPAMEGGSSLPFTLSVTVPPDTAPGTHYLWVVADADDAAGQPNRANDAAALAVAIEYVPCTDPTAAITLEDANLEAVVRAALGLPGGSITCADMALLTNLDAPDAGIARLDGLQHAVNLLSLNLTRNEVSDLAPVENLVKLEGLWLYGNQVADLAPLAKLTALQGLSVENNLVADLAPLAGLGALRNVWLGTNEIADVSALQGLPDLADIHLLDNLLTDLAPLVANPGIGAGDHLDVSVNCLDVEAGSTAMLQVGQLQARGVDVAYALQKECEP